jgi:hypothetical protein
MVLRFILFVFPFQSPMGRRRLSNRKPPTGRATDARPRGVKSPISHLTREVSARDLCLGRCKQTMQAVRAVDHQYSGSGYAPSGGGGGSARQGKPRRFFTKRKTSRKWLAL